MLIPWESGPPQKFGCGVFYGSNPHENFTEINLILAKSTPGAVFKPIKCSKSPDRWGFAPDPTEGAYSTSPGHYLVGRGTSPPQEPHPLSALRASLFDPWGWPFQWNPTMLHKDQRRWAVNNTTTNHK